MKKSPADERFEKTEFDLWEAITAIDRKDYGYWDKLTPEQQRKFVPYMMLQWIATLKNDGAVSQYYLRSTDYHANMHMFNERVQQHPKLQWLMLCASSPGKGKQFHAWIPQLSSKVTTLKERATLKEVNEYLSKTYANADPKTVTEMASAWTENQNRSHYIAKNCPNLKLDDIATLAAIISDHEIEEHRNDTTF